MTDDLARRPLQGSEDVKSRDAVLCEAGHQADSSGITASEREGAAHQNDPSHRAMGTLAEIYAIYGGLSEYETAELSAIRDLLAEIDRLGAELAREHEDAERNRTAWLAELTAKEQTTELLRKAEDEIDRLRAEITTLTRFRLEDAADHVQGQLLAVETEKRLRAEVALKDARILADQQTLDTASEELSTRFAQWRAAEARAETLQRERDELQRDMAVWKTTSEVCADQVKAAKEIHTSLRAALTALSAKWRANRDFDLDLYTLTRCAAEVDTLASGAPQP